MTRSALSYSFTGQTSGLAPDDETGVVLGFTAAGSTVGDVVPRIVVADRLATRSRRERILRRLRGVLLEFDGDEARTMLGDGETTEEYWLPADPLRKAGVQHVGQPFEMDEFERLGTDECTIGYRYRPSAALKDAYIEEIDFDTERQAKLKEIIKADWEHATD